MEDNKNKKMKKPTFYLVMKIIGFSVLAIGLILLICGITKNIPSMGQAGWFDAESAKNGLISGGVTCIFVSIALLITGFTPEIAKMSAKHQKYIQQETKEDLTDIANTSADIVDDAIVTTVKAVKKGLSEDEEKSVFCKHCGKEIDFDSTFCKHCGKEQ